MTVVTEYPSIDGYAPADRVREMLIARFDRSGGEDQYALRGLLHLGAGEDRELDVLIKLHRNRYGLDPDCPSGGWTRDHARDELVAMVRSVPR
jgi:hypothetical protein